MHRSAVEPPELDQLNNTVRPALQAPDIASTMEKQDTMREAAIGASGVATARQKATGNVF